MTDRPILFSAPMVRAMLAGTKTQTRRTIKPLLKAPPGLVRADIESDDECFWVNAGELLGRPFRCPYGVPGDGLWAKERHRFDIAYDKLKPTLIPASAAVFYEAGGQVGDGVPGKSRVSLHMQRRFCRIERRVTDVRVERLNDISEADAMAEGVVWSDLWQGFVVLGVEHPNKDFPILSRATAREMYAALWDLINGSGAWLANPWVWAVTFEDVPRT